jgi:L-cysteine:1D-myo-inositol 2-amino-2-deoxy-alpha-D-glucopyranoside ligase
MVLDRGFAYQAGGNVYFDVSKFTSFGSVSNYSEEFMVELANERGGNIADPNKRHPLDFVLWQTSAPDEPAWETMWGAGRPGWHIECSALALRELGTTIDLHGGGSDLIFPHHECERAQSEAATGVPFVRHWMHVAMVSMDGHKMSKSRGNLVFVDALRKEWDPRVIRLGLVAHHYRVEWEWNTNIMPDALARLQLWQSVSQDAGTTNSPASQALLAEVRDALDDDLNSPFALQLIDAAARAQVNVATSAALLGVQL